MVRKRVDDQELVEWLAAADCTLFNYTSILTSGSACLARSLGVPVVLPGRLDTIDLGEPHPHVFRFHDGSDFGEVVAEALEAPRDRALADEWRLQTSWENVAAKTNEIYASTR